LQVGGIGKGLHFETSFDWTVLCEKQDRVNHRARENGAFKRDDGDGREATHKELAYRSGIVDMEKFSGEDEGEPAAGREEM
jgi:hypothetical protein